MGKKNNHGHALIEGGRDHKAFTVGEEYQEEVELSDYGEDPFNDGSYWSGICPNHDRMEYHHKVDPRVDEAPRMDRAAIKLAVVTAKSKSKAKKLLKQHHDAVAEEGESANNEQGEQPRQLSRKERKRLVAQAHAQSKPRFCDLVVSGATGLDEMAAWQQHQHDQLIALPCVSHPFAGLSSDLIGGVILPFLPVPSIIDLCSAAVGVDILLKVHDNVWGDIFTSQRLAQRHATQWKRLERRSMNTSLATPSAVFSWAYIVRYVTSSSQDQQEGRSNTDQQQREAFDSEGSAMVRRHLEDLTKEWETMSVHAWVRRSDPSHIVAPIATQRALFWRCGWWRKRKTASRYAAVDVATDTIGNVRKSELFSQQYCCEHRSVVLDTKQHWFKCLDCDLYTHAVFDRPDIWHL